MSNTHPALDQESIGRILRALQGLEYGSVQIVVHDSKITQIERTEKHRFPLEKSNPEYGHENKTKRK
ncbi:YezD family protein [Brevibacillus sp. SYP-B805]|uniref:YezD family protein n=1 Tax=Brevibacillus sp. SYP-B805 TaxID=1578199 RepID=UPI001F49CBCA|nr:YezD family protein [Brevibacillus sp. SYP-B805]